MVGGINRMGKKKCPHCDYDCPIDLFKKHLGMCDKNKKGKSYRSKLKFTDRFFLAPVATLILIISFLLAIILRGSLWYFIIVICLIWITIKKDVRYNK